MDDALTGGTIQAVFDTDAARLYVDINKDGFFVAGDDLQNALSGVAGLTVGTDLLF